MGKVGAQYGNINGRKGTEFRDALRKALYQYEDDKVKRGQALYHIGRIVVKKALGGEHKAIEAVADRLDGKAPQAVSLDVETHADQAQIDLLDTARRILWLINEAERQAEAKIIEPEQLEHGEAAD